MKTIWEDVTRQELKQRMARLQPDAQPRWGKMDCVQMLAHNADWFRMLLGEVAVKPNVTWIFRATKHLFVFWLPFPKNAPSSPELLRTQSHGIESEIADINALLEKIAKKDHCHQWPIHAAFGKMSRREWGVFAYRHLDHHLRQFGV
jgi:hypothetical protein